MKPAAAFPSPELIAETWRLPSAELLPFEHGHGAQMIVRAPGEPDWVLKRARADTGELAAFNAVLNCIGHLGESIAPAAFPEIRAASDGARALEIDGARYYMLRRVQGSKASFRSLRDTRRVMAALASYHCAAAAPSADLRARLGKPENCPAAHLWENPRAQWDELEKLIAERAAALPWPGSLFLRGQAGMRRSYEMARVCAEELHNGPPLPVTLTHGDTHANNFLLDSGCVWMLDLESYALRPAVMDLAIPLVYFGRFHGWRPKAIERALEGYEIIRPLSETERRALRMLLIFPRQWARAMTALLRRGRGFASGPMRNLAEALWRAKGHRRFAEHAMRHW